MVAEVRPPANESGAAILKDGVIHMFYISGIKWVKIGHKLEHTYSIKHATSNDGVNWELLPHYAIFPQNRFEAIAAPTVIEINKIYHMWFSYRGSDDFRDGKNSYKIGYAFSTDLYKWLREDKLAGIEKSKEGWDSTMICYPYVFKQKDEYFMIYNGNSFGKESLGIAKLMQYE